MKPLVWTFLRKILKLFLVLPIQQNKILFMSFGGNQYSCSPKYISEYISKYYPDKFTTVWAFKQPDKHSELKSKGIKIVSVNSINFIKHFYTSKIIVTNDNLYPFLEKRKEQIGIQTWHGGGAYKKVGRNTKLYSKNASRQLTSSMKNMNLYLSSCKSFNQFLIRDAFSYEGEILEEGLPRNDFLINQNGIKNKVRDTYCIPYSHVVILYAPTFRNNFNSDTYNIDYATLRENVKMKYNKECTILYRFHHKIKESQAINLKSERLVDVSQYPDMQEILYDADILITDYSSTMWDFSLMFKPCFIYATALECYRNERDFYTPIEQWPFPVASNNNDLINNIIEFDKIKYDSDVKTHHQLLGNFESGHATESVVKYILNNYYG